MNVPSRAPTVTVHSLTAQTFELTCRPTPKWRSTSVERAPVPSAACPSCTNTPSPAAVHLPRGQDSCFPSWAGTALSHKWIFGLVENVLNVLPYLCFHKPKKRCCFLPVFVLYAFTQQCLQQQPVKCRLQIFVVGRGSADWLSVDSQDAPRCRLVRDCEGAAATKRVWWEVISHQDLHRRAGMYWDSCCSAGLSTNALALSLDRWLKSTPKTCFNKKFN